MEAKTFEAFSMADAMKKVKAEMGQEAVILSTKERMVKPKGHSKSVKMFEVKAIPSAQTKESSIPARVFTPAAGKKFSKYDVAKNNFQQNQERAKAMLRKQSPSNETDSPQPTPQPNINLGLVDPPISNEVQALSQDIKSLEKELHNLPLLDTTSDLMEIKTLLLDIYQSSHVHKFENCHPYLQDICLKLKSCGVADIILSNTLQIIQGTQIPNDKNQQPLAGEALRDYFINRFLSIFVKNIKIYDFQLEKEQRYIGCVLGQSGVGKSASLAKLAVHLRKSKKQKVGFIHFDSLNDTLQSSLKVYSQILECPYHVVQDAAELENVIHSHPNIETFLMDTPALSTELGVVFSQLMDLKNLEIPINFHLCIPAYMKSKDMSLNIRQVKRLNLSSLIFTMTDLSYSYGDILSASLMHKVPLSVFGTGRRIPNDL